MNSYSNNSKSMNSHLNSNNSNNISTNTYQGISNTTHNLNNQCDYSKDHQNYPY